MPAFDEQALPPPLRSHSPHQHLEAVLTLTAGRMAATGVWLRGRSEQGRTKMRPISILAAATAPLASTSAAADDGMISHL